MHELSVVSRLLGLGAKLHRPSRHAGGRHKPPGRKNYKDKCRAAARARLERGPSS